MVGSDNRTTLTPSLAALSGKSMDDTPLNTTTVVTVLLSGAVLVALVIALLIYRYYRRTSGPVWITKVLTLYRCNNDNHCYCYMCCTFRIMCCGTFISMISKPAVVNTL